MKPPLRPVVSQEQRSSIRSRSTTRSRSSSRGRSPGQEKGEAAAQTPLSHTLVRPSSDERTSVRRCTSAPRTREMRMVSNESEEPGQGQGQGHPPLPPPLPLPPSALVMKRESSRGGRQPMNLSFPASGASSVSSRPSYAAEQKYLPIGALRHGHSPLVQRGRKVMPSTCVTSAASPTSAEVTSARRPILDSATSGVRVQSSGSGGDSVSRPRTGFRLLSYGSSPLSPRQAQDPQSPRSVGRVGPGQSLGEGYHSLPTSGRVHSVT
jgi:hypothetical protein